jgi:hypothetical protein
VVLVVLSSLVSLAIAVALVLLKGRPRHLLAAALVPLAFIPPLVASAAAASRLGRTFAGAAESGGTLLGSNLVEVAHTAFVGRACTLGLLVLALSLVIAGLFQSTDGGVGRSRATVLLSAPALAIALALLLGWSEDRMIRTITLVMMPADVATPATEAELRDLFPGTAPGEMPGIARISAFVASQLLLLAIGGPLLGLAFVGLAGMAAAAGWRPPSHGSPRLAALGLGAVLGLVGVWTASAYRRVDSLQDWAQKVTASARRDAAAAGPRQGRPLEGVADGALLQRCEGGDAGACAAAGAGMDDGRRLAMFERVCAKTGGEVCAHLGSLHLNGVGTAADPARAKALYDRACHTGDASACGRFEQLSKRAVP